MLKKRFEGFLLFSFVISFAGRAQAFDCPDRFKVFDERRGWICADGFGEAKHHGFSTADEIHESPGARLDRNDHGDVGFSENFENPNYQPVGIVGNDDRRLLTWEETRRAAVGIVGCTGSLSTGSVVYQGNLVVTAKHTFFEDVTNQPKCSGKPMLFLVRNPETGSRTLYNVLKVYAPPDALPSDYEGYSGAHPSDVLVAKLDRPVAEFTPTYLPESVQPFMRRGEITNVTLFGFFNDFKDNFPRKAPGNLFFSGSQNFPSFIAGGKDVFITDIDSSPNVRDAYGKPTPECGGGSSGSPILLNMAATPVFLGIFLWAHCGMDRKPFSIGKSGPPNFGSGLAVTKWLRDTLFSLEDPSLRHYYYSP